MKISVTETTVYTIGALRIGVANIWADDDGVLRASIIVMRDTQDFEARCHAECRVVIGPLSMTIHRVWDDAQRGVVELTIHNIACPQCESPLPINNPALTYQKGGDEHTIAIAHCPYCEHFSAITTHDRFMHDACVTTTRALCSNEARTMLAKITACSAPHNKRCDCVSHRYFGDG